MGRSYTESVSQSVSRSEVAVSGLSVEAEGWPDDVTGLYLVFSPQRTLDGELTVRLCQASGFTARRGRDKEEQRGGGEDPVTAAWGQICLLGEVN